MLGKLFRRDYRHYLERADRMLELERFAEARELYSSASERLPADISGEEEVKGRIARGLRKSGDRLGEMNVAEAEYAAEQGVFHKAEEHLRLALTLAEDVTIREKAEKLLEEIATPPPSPVQPDVKSAMATCSCSTGKHVEYYADSHEDLEAEDRFSILVHSLPGDLPQRYESLGEKFAYGYLMANAGDLSGALTIFNDLLRAAEHDILLYELALVHYRMGNTQESERLLNRAHSLNAGNPAVALGLAQFYLESERFTEAEDHLRGMIASSVLAEQASLMLGELHEMRGDDPAATELYVLLLADERTARPAAERLAPLLARQGRDGEAQAVAKRYLKGCC